MYRACYRTYVHVFTATRVVWFFISLQTRNDKSMATRHFKSLTQTCSVQKFGTERFCDAASIAVKTGNVCIAYRVGGVLHMREHKCAFKHAYGFVVTSNGAIISVHNNELYDGTKPPLTLPAFSCIQHAVHENAALFTDIRRTKAVVLDLRTSEVLNAYVFDDIVWFTGFGRSPKHTLYAFIGCVMYVCCKDDTPRAVALPNRFDLAGMVELINGDVLLIQRTKTGFSILHWPYYADNISTVAIHDVFIRDAFPSAPVAVTYDYEMLYVFTCADMMLRTFLVSYYAY